MLLSLSLSAVACVVPAQEDAAGVEFFETKIRPVLIERCVRCHGEDKQRSGLRVDSLGAMLFGGERGPAVVPGDLEQSLLIRAVRYDDEELEMPPKGKLADEVIADLERWVSMGAPAPEEGTEEHAPYEDEFNLEERAKHWSFQPVADPAAPAVSNEAWPRDDVDRFLLARLDAAGLAPAHDTDPGALLRRLSYDLRGVPPTLEETRAFLAAAGDGPEALDAAYAGAVERWLAAPDYAETWARHWLDLMRYADSKGHEFDHTIPNAYQYRDYVIRAFEADVPYDRFLTEHIAGDMTTESRPNAEEGWDESALGTGWWFLSEEVHSPVDTRADQVERIANQVDVFGKAFLGLTVSCARCHDHKFDPVTQEDYYALAGYALSTTYQQVRLVPSHTDQGFADTLAERRVANTYEACVNTASSLRPTVATLAERLLQPDEAMQAELEAARARADHPLFLFARTRGLEGAEFASALQAAREEQKARVQEVRAWTAAEKGWLSLAGDLPQSMSFLTPPKGLPPDFDLPRIQARVSLGAEPRIEAPMSRFGVVWDPAWSGAGLASDAEREPSNIDWVQPGRTLRTETIVLEQPRLWYRVRGAGHAFVQVDGHRMLKGPLHAAVRRSWDADADAGDARWIEHDLSEYVGHRVHVELSPAEDAPIFEVLSIVEAEAQPPAFESPDFAMRLWGIEAGGEAELAAHMERVALGLVDALAAGSVWPDDLSVLLRRSISGFEPSPVELPEDLAALRPPAAMTAPGVAHAGRVDENLLIRGSALSPGDLVPQRLLEVLGGKEPLPMEAFLTQTGAAQGLGRQALAWRMVDPTNPLVARVYVNRIWHHLFGRGLVPTTDNFGISGDVPSHPELLDHLTTWFVRDGWSTKRLIAKLVSTRAYRLASSANPDVDDHPEEVDPTNALLHRAHVRRLPAEKIRDGVLALSGGLNDERFGPAVPVHLTPFQDGRGRPKSGPIDGDGRRSIYLAVRRNFLSPFLQAFDYPTPATCRGQRSVSNVPAQALALMNDPFVVGEARRWGERVALEDGSIEERVARMALGAWGRAADDAELVALTAEVSAGFQGGGDGPTSEDLARGFADVAHVLFNTKEMIYLR